MEKDLNKICMDIRCDTIMSIGHLGVGHIGGCLSVVELLGVLYFEAMRIDPKDPKKAGRDRFICSKGHAGPAVYATLANRGYFDKTELLTLNQGGTNLPSHCDMLRTTGIDMTTGSLGQGFSCAVGAALGAKLARDGAIVYTLIGDGESQEGQIWEAAMFAAIGGTIAEINDIAPLAEKWAAFGWHVIEVEDGNDVEQVSAAVAHAKLGVGSGKPTMVILNTVKGCGVPWVVELKSNNHNAAFTEEQAIAAVKALRGEE